MKTAPIPCVCDLCAGPFMLPAAMVRDGHVYGLLVCTQCTEDALDAATLDRGSTLEMVGGSR